ncbi:MAG: DUF1552 domain-containing protein [Myxococcota bacterium]
MIDRSAKGHPSQSRKSRVRRRQFLRGAGATLALPTLVSLLPRAARAQTAPKRYLQIFHPNGTTQRVGDVTPPSELMRTLGAFRDRMTVVYNMDNNQIRWQMGPYSNHHHMNCRIVLYSGDIFRGVGGESITVDQHIANRIGNDSAHRSIAINLVPAVASQDGVPPIHFSAVGWRGPGQAVEPYSSPRRLFNTLFGGTSTTPAPEPGTPSVSHRRRTLVLDAMVDEIGDVRRRASTDDRLRLDEYLTGIEELDRRTRELEDVTPPMLSCDTSEPANLDAGASNYPAFLEVMQELSIRALQCDATRVINFCHCSVAGSGHGLQHPFVSGFEGRVSHWHPLSHWRAPYGHLSSDVELNHRDLRRMLTWHYERVAHFLGRLADTPSGEGGNLLDDTLVAWGSSMSDGSDHRSTQVYQVLVGGGDRLRHGSDIDLGGRYAANMFTSVMHAFGAEGRLGQANGDIDSELLR